jgi:ubiquitin-like protein Nedd8
MQIFIKTLTGRKQSLNFEEDNTVLEVKQALQEKEGIQVDQIRSSKRNLWMKFVISSLS